MARSPSIPTEHVRLIFSTNSLRNCSIQCDALGLHYQLSTPMDGMVKNGRTTTITRWDPHEGRDIVIAEWRGKLIGFDRIRPGSFYTPGPLIVNDSSSENGFIAMDQFFPRASGIPGFPWFKQTFTANGGKCYTWVSREFSLKLFEEGLDAPIAEYRDSNFFINKRNAYLRIVPGCEKILDYIVVTCVIAQRARRDASRPPLLEDCR